MLTKTIEEIVAESNAQIVGQVMGRDVTRGELSEAFKLVADKSNWKNRIDALVVLTEDQMHLVHDAVIFFTGSVPHFQPLQIRNNYRVTAAGYYSAIGA